jgi:hypothetical protein
MTQAWDQESGRQEGLAGQATATVEEAAGAAQEKAADLREEGSARLRDQLDERSTRAGEQVRSLAGALRRSGDELGNEGNDRAARFTAQAADRMEQLGSYLEQKGGDELMRDIEGFARRRPWLLAGLGLLAGVAAARFVKASSEERYGEYRSAGRQGLTAPAGRFTDEPVPLSPGVPATLGDDPIARDPYAGPR